MIKILVTNRNTGVQKQYNLNQNTILIGRQNTCDVILDSNSISRRHAQLILNKHLVELEDLGSGNGTILNQEKITGKERTPVKSGDKIRIEEFDMDLEIASSNLGANPESSFQTKFDITDPDIIEIKMIKKVLGALDQDRLPSLTILSEPFVNKKVVFEEGLDELVVGRDPECQLVLDSSVVSRKHSTISVKWGSYVINDLGSKNGTFVNGERIEEKSIKDGDEVVFGTLKAIFKNPQEFDIAAITRSINESKEQSKKQKEEKLNAPPVRIPIEPTPQPVSAAEKQTITQTATESTPQKEKAEEAKEVKSESPKKEEEPVKETEKEKSKKVDQKELDNILENDNAKDEKKADAQASKKKIKAKKSKKGRLSPAEIIIFVLGGCIFVIALAGLVKLLS